MTAIAVPHPILSEYLFQSICGPHRAWPSVRGRAVRVVPAGVPAGRVREEARGLSPLGPWAERRQSGLSLTRGPGSSAAERVRSGCCRLRARKLAL